MLQHASKCLSFFSLNNSLSIHLSVDGHMSFSLFVAIVNNAAMSMGVQILFKGLFKSLLSILKGYF